MEVRTGQIIKQLREEKGLSQTDMALIIGINNSVLSRIESGKRPVEDTEIIKFAEYFRVSTDYLLGLSEFKKGRLLTVKDLRTFLPEETVNNHEIKAIVDKLDDATKREIIKLLKEKGIMS